MKTTIVPLITEKTMTLAGKGFFTFKTEEESNKYQIAKTIEDLFKVHVIDIKTAVMKGKTRRVGKKRHLVKTGKWKKAIVKLKKGEKIDLFTVEQAKETK